jgi:ornithine cyclodeaminase/alanine dehydrogenase-like protein (mu-crystallin family)
MEAQELIYLTQQQVIDLMPTLSESIAVIEGVLREHGDGEVENPPKPGVHPLPDTFIHAMPGYLRRKGLAGLKWVGGFFDNPERGLPSISGLIVLNSVETGLPLAVMDCSYITAVRTAAVSAVGAKHLARAGAKVLGIVGAGLQGRYNLLTLAEVLPGLETVHVYDSKPAALERYVASMSEHVGASVAPVESAQAAMAEADVVVTATSWLTVHIFDFAWVKPGALVLPVHNQGWNREAPRQADRLVVDDWGQLSTSLGAFYDLPDAPDAELGEIVTGRKPGRESDDQRILDFNYGMAIHDVAMSSEVLARATAQGVGTPLAQLDGRFPFME